MLKLQVHIILNRLKQLLPYFEQSLEYLEKIIDSIRRREPKLL